MRSLIKSGVRFRFFVIGLTSLIIFTGCGKESINAIEINNANAVQITVSELPKYKKVIALANGAPEIISALGYKSILIGRDIASTDEDLKAIPIVTSGHQVVPEKIISLKPDLVIIDKSTGPKNAIKALVAAKINVVEVLEAWQLADVSKKVIGVASALGTPMAGEELNLAMSSLPTPVTNSNQGIRVAFLYLRGGSAIYLIGGKGSGADSLIDSVGAVDVGAAKLKNPFTAMTSEEMAALNPQVLLVMTKGLASTGGVSGLISLPGIAQTDAGKSKRVISVDDSLLLSFGPRTPDLLFKLQDALTKVMKL